MMNKTIGIFLLLVVTSIVTAMQSDSFLGPMNTFNLMQRSALYGMIGIGVSFVIVTGGIDLSIGSIIGLMGTLFPLLLAKEFSPVLAFAIVMGLSGVIGILHGLLVTKLKLQPFVVTLCGLLVYRGIARWISQDSTQGFRGFEDLRWWAVGKIPLFDKYALPIPLLLFLGFGVLAWLFFHRTIWGRQLLALGRNEQAAIFSGIKTDRLIIFTYFVSALIAGLAGVLFALHISSVQPASHGNFYELYAIAAAVLGGCSLRGGEASVIGVMLASAVIRVIQNMIVLLGIAAQLEYAVLGVVILLGVISDEFLRRWSQRRRLG